MFRGKNYKASIASFDKTNSFEPEEAMKIVVDTAKAKFDETIELHVKLGVDSRHADQQVRGVCVLPNGTGKTVKVLVIAKGEKADQAQAAGADFVGAEDMIAKIQNEGWFGFDVMITTPDMMGLVGRLGKVLGPKGLMPNPKSGTVTMELQHGYGSTRKSETRSVERYLPEKHHHRRNDGPRRQSHLSHELILLLFIIIIRGVIKNA